MSNGPPTRRSVASRDLTPDQRYWQLWRAGRRPDLAVFLAGLPSPSPGDVAAVVAIDQYERWRAGERVPAEDYLTILPASEGREQAECDIVYGEYLLREQLGESPALDDYQRRFPALAEALDRQVQLHLALADADAVPYPTMSAQPVELVEEYPAIPGYEILEEIGRGGMGVVYKAKQVSLARLVALKVLRVKPDRDAIDLERMWREAHVTARLSHPNIVTIYDAGLAGEWFYIAMEYVAGADLYHLVERSGAVPIDRACDYLRQAAAGLQHAHERGMVHRDIKPSNLIVSPAGESRPEVLKLLDLGLARPAPTGAPGEALTHLGSFMGTPDFIAPEQANDPRAADVRSDLYSLGCTFYYVLTGRPPFAGSTPLAKLMQHHSDEPPPLEGSIPAGLAAIIRKLMAKQPADRFQTPAELIDALDAFRAGAAPATVVRRPAGPFRVALLRRLTGPADWVKCVAFAPDGAALAAGSVDRTLRLWDAATGSETWRGEGHQAAVLCLAFAPDGRLVSGGQDRALCLWERDGNALRLGWRATGHRDNINAVCFLPGGERLLSASHDGTLRLWEAAQGRECGVWSAHSGPVWGVAVSADGRLALSGGQDRTIRLWEVERGRLLSTWPEQPSVVSCVALSPDGRLALTGGLGGAAQLWDVAAARVLTTLEGHAGRITAAAFAPDGRHVLTGSRDQTARLFAAGGGAALATLAEHNWWVTAVAWSPDGTRAATGSGDRTVAVWQLTANG